MATNGVKAEAMPPLTDNIIDFIVSAKYESIPAQAISKLKDLIVDHIGVSAGAALGSDSSAPIFTGITEFIGNASGNCTVYTKGKKYTPQHAALLNGSYAHSYDFDDTYAAGTVHIGASIIPAALAMAESVGASGEDTLLAIAVGYEIVCRLSRALGPGCYTRGFHNTGTTGIFGSVGAIAILQKLDRQVVADAIGLAGSKCAGSMQYLDNGAWNKRLHPGFAAHDAVLCVSLAKAGVTGASRTFEGVTGILHAFSDSSNPAGFSDGLGSEWEFPKTAMKPYSACRYTHTGIELLAGIGEQARAKFGKDTLPKRITAHLAPAAYGIVGVEQPNKMMPDNLVDCQFSHYYQCAIAWLYGAGIGFSIYDDDKMKSETVKELCKRVKCVNDKTVPWWGTVLDVELEDGTHIKAEMAHPLGEDEHPFSTEEVRKKFRGLIPKVYDEKRAEQIIQAVDVMDKAKAATDLTSLL